MPIEDDIRPGLAGLWDRFAGPGQSRSSGRAEGRGFSNAKAKRELGRQLRYPSWRQGFKEALA